MKILTIAVPCYNSEAYLRSTVDNLLLGGEDVEIILVNDGSKDGTLAIIEDYARRFPTIVKAIDKENGGHGSGINKGIEEATGYFFKVVDSDDHLDTDNYPIVLDTLRELAQNPEPLDLFICNFEYDKVGAKRKKVMKYCKQLPQDRVFGWDEIHRLHTGRYILMHSVIYRTQLLKDCGIRMPEHTFYVDNLFVFQPLPFVKTIYYKDVLLYKYYIGRDDQSVNEDIMKSRIDQQLKVNLIMLRYMVSVKQDNINKNLLRYMYNYLDVITAVSSVFLIRINTKEALLKKKMLWRFIRRSDMEMYARLRSSPLGISMNLPGRGGRKVSNLVYTLAWKIYKFN